MERETGSKLYNAYLQYDENNEKHRVKLTLKNGEVFIGTPFHFHFAYPEDIYGDEMVFLEEDERGFYIMYLESEVSAAEVIKV